MNARLVLLLPLLGLSACESDLLSYSLRQGLRQGGIIMGARKIDWVLRQPGLDPKVVHLLQLSQKVLKFAADELHMKTGQSYRSYYDLRRSYLTQVVMAAYPDRLENYLFKFPVIGALPYKGYFEESEAIEFENALKRKGFDTYRRDVDAFSSLGWFADPLLSTMLNSEGQLTQLLFHELTHLNFYFEGESDFNEAFATYFGVEASRRLLRRHPEYFSDAAQVSQELETLRAKQRQLGEKIRVALDYGKKFYQQRPLPDRQIFFDWLRQHFAATPELGSLRNLVWNNALLLSLGTYYELIPRLESYATAQQWDEKAFLEEVLRQGAGIIPKILK